MSLINDTDLRKILKIDEDEGEWLVNTFKLFFGIDKLNQLYNENSTLSGLDFIDSVINKLGVRYTVSEDFEKGSRKKVLSLSYQIIRLAVWTDYFFYVWFAESDLILNFRAIFWFSILKR